MTKKQQQTWLPLSQLPLFAQTVTGMLKDTEVMYPLFAQAKDKPWVLDDETVERAIRLYTERLDILALDEEQLARWKKEKLTRQEEDAVTKLTEQTARTKELVTRLLEIAHEIKQNTIDRILARDPAELAIDVLMGKLKMSK